MTKIKTPPDAPVKKTSGKRNKAAGHNFEREVVNTLKTMGFPHASTSRLQSRARDAQKVDVMNENEVRNGRIPYNFQCKNSAIGSLPYAQLLSEMPVGGPEINVVLHNQTVRRGTRFLTKGQYATTNMADFFRLIQRLQNITQGFTILNEYFDCLPEEDKAAVATQLEALGL